MGKGTVQISILVSSVAEKMPIPDVLLVPKSRSLLLPEEMFLEEAVTITFNSRGVRLLENNTLYQRVVRMGRCILLTLMRTNYSPYMWPVHLVSKSGMSVLVLPFKIESYKFRVKMLSTIYV